MRLFDPDFSSNSSSWSPGPVRDGLRSFRILKVFRRGFQILNRLRHRKVYLKLELLREKIYKIQNGPRASL